MSKCVSDSCSLLPKDISNTIQYEKNWDEGEVVVEDNSILNQLWLEYLIVEHITKSYGHMTTYGHSPVVNQKILTFLYPEAFLGSLDIYSVILWLWHHPQGTSVHTYRSQCSPWLLQILHQTLHTNANMSEFCFIL